MRLQNAVLYIGFNILVLNVKFEIDKIKINKEIEEI
jgi:hypothetical protein